MACLSPHTFRHSFFLAKVGATSSSAKGPGTLELEMNQGRCGFCKCAEQITTRVQGAGRGASRRCGLRLQIVLVVRHPSGIRGVDGRGG